MKEISTGFNRKHADNPKDQPHTGGVFFYFYSWDSDNLVMIHDYNKILEIGESFFSVKDANDLLELILKHGKEICDAERSTLFIKETDLQNDEEVLRSFMATEIGGKLKEITVSSKIGIVGYAFKTGDVQIVNDVTNNDYFNSKIDEQTNFKTRSIISVPLIQNFGKPFGVIQVLNKREGDFTEEDIRKVKLLSLLAATALARIHDRQQLAQMKKHLNEMNSTNLEHISFESSHPGLKQIYSNLDVVASSISSVLLLGESGTGKEVMARQIHSMSERRESPFVIVNCAAIPATLFEAELFGIAGGVATDVTEREGVFQKANGGTLFLDEIGELPFEMQSKLLRVLQERKVSRVGETDEKSVDVRLITATNRDLSEEIKKENGFREDLFFRINVFQFRLPSLHERIVDLEFLSRELLMAICVDQNLPPKSLTQGALEKLKGYKWPGNIRELKNVLERACVLSQQNEIIDESVILIPDLSSETRPALTLVEPQSDVEISEMNIVTKQFQKDYALKVVDHFEGNKTQAAKSLKLSREGLRKILNRKTG